MGVKLFSSFLIYFLQCKCIAKQMTKTPNRPIPFQVDTVNPMSSFTVSNYNFDKSKQCIGAMTIEIDFLQKKSTDTSPYDSDKMAAEFIQQFNNQGFSVTQQVRVMVYLQLQSRHSADVLNSKKEQHNAMRRIQAKNLISL